MIPTLPEPFRKDRLAEREGILPKFPGRTALIMLAIVLIITLAGITLFFTAGH